MADKRLFRPVTKFKVELISRDGLLKRYDDEKDKEGFDARELIESIPTVWTVEGMSFKDLTQEQIDDIVRKQRE